ncbi:MAG: peptidase M28, partial [Acidobacteria bacterium]|nr:peptidase M28 [Acidobacteriota bacterium]
MTRCKITIALLLLALTITGWPISARQSQPSKNTNDSIERIKDEGMNRSRLIQTLSYLTDVIGPRLTASPNLK